MLAGKCKCTLFPTFESVLWFVSRSNRISDPENTQNPPSHFKYNFDRQVSTVIPCLGMHYPGYGPRLKPLRQTLGDVAWRESADGWSPRLPCPLWSGNRWGCCRRTGLAECRWWNVWACKCWEGWFSGCPFKTTIGRENGESAFGIWHRTSQKRCLVHVVRAHSSTPVASPCRALCQLTGRNSTFPTLPWCWACL